MDTSYEGDEISFEELPVGCEIFHYSTGNFILIRSPKDAKALIESLTRFVESFTEK